MGLNYSWESFDPSQAPNKEGGGGALWQYEENALIPGQDTPESALSCPFG